MDTKKLRKARQKVTSEAAALHEEGIRKVSQELKDISKDIHWIREQEKTTRIRLNDLLAARDQAVEDARATLKEALGAN